MTTFRQYDDIAVVEHDPDTRQSKRRGTVRYGTIDATNDTFTLVAYGDGISSRPQMFDTGSGWAAAHAEYRWRLVPLCRCERPVLTGDGQFCSDECRDDAAEAQSVQRYGYGVAT